VTMPTALNESSASESVGSDLGAAWQQRPRLADQISADSLVLHRYRAAHAPVVWEAIEQSRATLQAWVPEVAGLRTLEQVATGLGSLEDAWVDGRKLVYAVFRRQEGSFVGEVGVYAFDWSRGAATIGLWLRDSAQGCGYGTLALAALTSHTQEALMLKMLEARVHPANDRSRRLMLRAGFQLIGSAAAMPESEGDVPEVLVYRRLAADLTRHRGTSAIR
jgi:RimJ/RimL family protein N-acetyltransferase